MSVVTLKAESATQHGFYVPEFEVKIEGVGLPKNILRDVTQITYKDNVKEIDSVELTVNNWDSSRMDFKYIGSETPETLKAGTPTALRYRLFEPCKKEVEIWMGYVGDLRLMLKGTFTTMEPHFPSGGAPTLTVRGMNVLHRLRTKQYTYAWQNTTDSKVAKDLESLKDGKKSRFPLPIQIDTEAMASEPELKYVAEENMYDIDFLLLRARQRGYVVFIQEADPKVKGSKRRLYFGPSHGARVPGLRDVTFELKWGQSLIDFKPTLTTANQIKSVTVKGWNRKGKEPIEGKATLSECKPKLNANLHELIEECDPREEVTVNEPVFTKTEAKKRACAILMDRHKEMVKASGTTVGLPDLRAGRLVKIEGVGSRLSGMYFVTDTTHTINDSGYITRFNARREDPEPVKQA